MALRSACVAYRRTRRILRTALLLVLSITTFVVALGVPSSSAGVPSDYPEYPYAATNYTEPYRGQFHFSAQNGWMNDVNGPVYYRGTYHLFYQHNPHGLGWATMHWGHATSTDLVHWVQKPISLEPGVHNGTLFSGSAWVDIDNVTGLKTGSDDPILLYTNTDGVSIAYSTDGARTFKMYNGGAKVITTSVESRDPKVQWDPASRRWVMVIWKAGAGATFFTSTNLLSWTEVGNYQKDWFFECPDLYRLPVDGDSADQKWVLQDAGGEYVIGSLNQNGMFVSDWASPQTMDKAQSFASPPATWYAAQTFNQLPGDRVVQLGWQPSNAGSTWTGNASFPVEVALKTLPEGIRITRNPVAEISSIRTSQQSWPARSISADPATDPFAGITADTYEIRAEFDLAGATASELRFQLHRRADGASGRTVAYSLANRTLYGQALAPVGNRVKIRLLVDLGQLEVFGNDGAMVLTDNVNFSSATSDQGISLTAQGGSVNLISLTFNRLGSIWSPTAGGVAPGNAIASTTRQGSCIDRDVASGRVQVWACNGGPNQSWTLGSDGLLKTEGVCLQLPAGQTANRTLVQTATCTSGANQKWRQGNFGSIVNQASGRCIDVDSADFTNGRQLQVWDCNGVAHQSWVGPAFAAATSRISWSATNSCVDRDVTGGQVQIWVCNGAGNQTWTTHPNGSLTTEGMCMQLPANQTENRTLVGVATCTGALNQAWNRLSNGGWMNLASGRCLDLDAGNPTNGRQLQVWDCVGGPNQTWVGPA